MNLRLFVLSSILLASGLARAADFKELKAGVMIRLTQATVVYDLDSAHHLFRDKSMQRWTELDEESPIALFGVGLKRRKLPAGTEGVMMKDAYLVTIIRNRNYADCMVVFRVGERHFMVRNSDSTMSDDLNELTSLVRAFPTVALRPTPTPAPGAVATLVDSNPR